MNLHTENALLRELLQEKHILASFAINCILIKLEERLSSLRNLWEVTGQGLPGIEAPDMDHSMSTEANRGVDTGRSQNRVEPLKMSMQHPSSKWCTGP